MVRVGPGGVSRIGRVLVRDRPYWGGFVAKLPVDGWAVRFYLAGHRGCLSGARLMALGFYFQPTGFTRAAYDEVIEELDRAGAGFGSVPGRTFHCAMEVDGSIAVFDIWESMEQFEKFGQTLIPIMNTVGVDPGQPQVSNIHNVQHG